VNIDKIIADYSSNPNVTISKQPDATVLTLTKEPNLSIEVAVPESVLEWVVTVKDSKTGRVILSDWMDHYSVKDETKEQLESERLEEIMSFLKAIVDSSLRLTELKKRRWFLWTKSTPVLEVRTADTWQKLLPF
jgi:hypothetical protein